MRRLLVGRQTVYLGELASPSAIAREVLRCQSEQRTIDNGWKVRRSSEGA